MNAREVIQASINDLTLLRVGRGRVKLSRSAVRACSAILGRISEEWDQCANDLRTVAVASNLRDMGQIRYAANCSSALRSAIARIAGSVRIEDLIRGYEYAEDSLSHTDADDPGAISPVLRKKS